MKVNNMIINAAIKHYRYNEEVNQKECIENFNRRYNFSAKKDNLKNYTYIIYGVLAGNPNCTHIPAKNLLYQEDEKCWQYFERTALFWTKSHINDPFIDHIRDAFQYSLYVEREDLIKILFEKSEEYLNREEYKNNKDYIKQKVYPSTQLLHFLIEKWLGYNLIKERVLGFGNSYGIYQKVIDNWENLSVLDSTYWDELCEYHLNGLPLKTSHQDNYYKEEFLGCGLVPMELINLIKVRKKLNLDIPNITHDLFQTPFAQEPKIPTSYNEDFDVLFQLVKKTVEDKKKYSLDEIRNEIELKSGTTNLILI